MKVLFVFCEYDCCCGGRTKLHTASQGFTKYIASKKAQDVLVEHSSEWQTEQLVSLTTSVNSLNLSVSFVCLHYLMYWLPHFLLKNHTAYISKSSQITVSFVYLTFSISIKTVCIQEYRVRQRGCSLTHSARTPPAVHPGMTIWGAGVGG